MPTQIIQTRTQVFRRVPRLAWLTPQQAPPHGAIAFLRPRSAPPDETPADAPQRRGWHPGMTAAVAPPVVEQLPWRRRAGAGDLAATEDGRRPPTPQLMAAGGYGGDHAAWLRRAVAPDAPAVEAAIRRPLPWLGTQAAPPAPGAPLVFLRRLTPPPDPAPDPGVLWRFPAWLSRQQAASFAVGGLVIFVSDRPASFAVPDRASGFVVRDRPATYKVQP